MFKILTIEDDRSLADVLAYNLRQAGYQVATAYDGLDGLTQAQSNPPDLILLDLMLPVMDGLEICRRLRGDPATRDVFILMLTAKADESDQLVGFSLGADDYVPKPFSVKVLLERIKAIERRRRGSRESDPDTVSKAGITVDRRRHEVQVGDCPLNVTLCEFRLLDAMIRQAGRAFQRSELIDYALGDGSIVQERTIDVHIRALRRKLGQRSGVIQTVRGVGYRFQDSDDL